MQKLSIKLKFLLLMVVFITSCTNYQPIKNSVSEDDFLESYHEMISVLYQNCVSTIEVLNKEIQTFNSSSNNVNFDKIKQQWKHSKRCYSVAEATRFNGSYIDEIDTFINAWPIDELYIDYVSSKPQSGIINNKEIKITNSNLLKLNEEQGEANISIGYHAIEFLLWGQDMSASGPGQRSWKDYTESPNHQRRMQYLNVGGRLLQKHMEDLLNNWKGNSYNSLTIDQIITGLGTFIKAELVGERMQVALDTYDQEDEQSCFSDQTNYDIIYNIEGTLAVLEGSSSTNYLPFKFNGIGLIDIFNHRDLELSKTLLSDTKAALKLMQSLDLPFDQAILPSNKDERRIIESVAKLMSGVAKNLRILQYTSHDS